MLSFMDVCCTELQLSIKMRLSKARTKDTPSQADRANICDILCKQETGCRGGGGHGTNALIPVMKYVEKQSNATNNRLVIAKPLAARSVLPKKISYSSVLSSDVTIRRTERLIRYL
jgi:hypothetical protein